MKWLRITCLAPFCQLLGELVRNQFPSGALWPRLHCKASRAGEYSEINSGLGIFKKQLMRVPLSFQLLLYNGKRYYSLSVGFFHRFHHRVPVHLNQCNMDLPTWSATAAGK